MRVAQLTVLLFAFCASLHAAEQLKCPEPVTRIAITQGGYSPQPGTVFELHDFAANMVARGKESPLCFMRTTEIVHGDIFISSEGLARMFKVDTHVGRVSRRLGFSRETHPDKVVLRGKMKKVISLPFTVAGPVTTDGRNLDLHAQSIKALGIPVKGLLDALGKELGDMIQSESVHGVAATGDTLIFQPAGISHVVGHIAKVSITDKGLHVQFTESPQQKNASQVPAHQNKKRRS
jgi:hypothetical protein